MWLFIKSPPFAALALYFVYFVFLIYVLNMHAFKLCIFIAILYCKPPLAFGKEYI